MKASSVKCGFFAFALLILCCFSALAQNKSCNLQLDVYEFKEDGTSEEFPVRDSKIKLVNTKTNKSIKISKKAETGTVFSAIEGDYKITISKNGFKNTVRDFSLSCEEADSQNTVSEIMFLWKGNSKETFKGYFEGPFNVVENTDKPNSEAKRIVSTGEPVNRKASILAKPEYPSAARAVRATGKVEVQVTINELGHVISAKAVSGHPLLQPAAVEAAKKSKFSQTTLSGIPVKVTGIIVYNFVP